MSQTNRVMVTGMGAITASGHSIDETWRAILEGTQGIAEIQQWDISSWAHRLGGEIKHFEPAKSLPDRKLLKVISRQDVLGINAAMQAVNHSQLLNYRETLNCANEFNEQTGVFVGSPGNKYYQQYDFLPLLSKTKGDMAAFAEQLSGEVHPMWLLRILPNNVLAYTGITYGFNGVNHNVANHAVSGTQAIIEAYHAIQQGQAERAIVVAYDVGTEPQSLFYYDKLGLISGRDLKPFDSQQDGTILADGAAAIVLESEASASRRGAACYAEIIGGAASSEASGLVSIEADGQSLSRLMTKTLEQRGIDPCSVGMVVAHGNGNPKSDVSEAHAIRAVFGEQAVPVTGFKWAMGHTLCASGILDTALMTSSLIHQCIPGIANLQEVASECSGLDVSPDTRKMDANKPYAMMINRGFASMNACLVIKRYE
jgi:3-oxoacyl-[acyl-carrier-protein] synthase-1